jgi:hypothetical protein
MTDLWYQVHADQCYAKSDFYAKRSANASNDVDRERWSELAARLFKCGTWLEQCGRMANF